MRLWIKYMGGGEGETKQASPAYNFTTPIGCIIWNYGYGIVLRSHALIIMHAPYITIHVTDHEI